MSEDFSEARPKPHTINSKNTAKVLDKNISVNLGRPLVAILKVILIFGLSQGLAALVLAAEYSIYSIFNSHFSSNLSHSLKYTQNNLENSAVLQFMYILIAETVAVFLVWTVLKVQGRSFKNIGYYRMPLWSDISRAITAFFGYYLVVIGLGILISLIAPEWANNQNQDVGFNSVPKITDQILAFMSLVILAPIAEETLMRGYLYTALRHRWKFVTSMLVTSLVFAIPHIFSGSSGSLVWLAGVNTFILSLFLVYIREKSGVLYSSIILHALNNLVAYFVHFHQSIF